MSTRERALPALHLRADGETGSSFVAASFERLTHKNWSASYPLYLHPLTNVSTADSFETFHWTPNYYPKSRNFHREIEEEIIFKPESGLVNGVCTEAAGS